MSIYEKFCSEILGDDGRPLNFTLNYNENFNFGYDVVDAIAEKVRINVRLYGVIQKMRSTLLHLTI